MTPELVARFAKCARTEVKIAIATSLVILVLPTLAIFALAGDGLAAISGGNAYLYQGPLSTTDTYAWGNCTYWVSLLRQQAGDPIPNTWGNAATWAIRAATDGYLVDQVPSVGAIMQTANSAGGLGHVAYVESVNQATGAWTISEMNAEGLDVVDTRTLTAAAALDYNFIHDRIGG